MHGAQLEAGKTSDISIQQNFDNSWRGLPYKPRAVTKDEIQKLREAHIWRDAPTLKNVEMIFITSDTMDLYNKYAVWAWTVDDSICLIEDGEVPYLELSPDKREEINRQRAEDNKASVITLEDVLEKEYLIEDGVGIRATFMIVDQGGHKADEIKHFAKMHRNVVMQKGTSMSSVNWKTSENQERLILTNERFWKSTAIYYLYSQKNRQENYLWFNPSITEESLAELRDVMPDNTSKWGDDPR